MEKPDTRSPRKVRRKPHEAWYYVSPQSIHLYVERPKDLPNVSSANIRLTRRQLQRMLDDMRESYAK